MKKSICVFRYCTMLLLIIFICGELFSSAYAAEYTGFQSAWNVLQSDGVLNEMSKGSQKFISKLKTLMSSGNTGLGSLYYTKNAGHGECWGFANAIMKGLFNFGEPSVSARTSGGNRSGLRGKNVFSYDLFKTNNVPQRGATLIRTQGTDHFGDQYDTGYGHSMVLLYYNETYVYLLDSNNNSSRSAAFWKLTWSEWTQREINNKSGSRRIKYVIAADDNLFNSIYDDQYIIIESKQLGVFRVIRGSGNLTDTPYAAGNIMASVRINVPISSLTPEDVVEVTEVVGNSYEASDPGNHQFAHLSNGYYIYYNDLEYLYSKVPGEYFPAICTQKDIKLLPFADASNVRLLSGATPLYVVATYLNKYGNIWYGVADTSHGAQIGYVNIKNISYDESRLVIAADKSQEFKVPQGTIPSGGNCGLRGTIVTNASIYEVRAEVVSRTTQEIMLTASCYPDAATTRININSSVNGNNINNLMKFGTLPDDYYTYQVCVTTGYDDIYPCVGGTYYLPEFTSNFQIGNPSGEDPLGDIVTPIGNVYVADIELTTTSGRINNTTVNLEINGTLQVSATALPSDATRKDVGWASSDTSIATVSDSGLLTAYQVGQAVISCHAKDSEHYTATFALDVTCSHASTNWVITKEATQTAEGSREERCNICDQVLRTETIPMTATLVNGITITRNGTAFSANESFTMDVGDETQLDKIVTPSNATNSNVIWSSSNTPVVSVSSNGYLNAWRNGTAKITCSSTDNSGIKAELNVTVQCMHRETTWVTIHEATSSQSGLRELECLICGDAIQTEVLPQITVPVSLLFLNRTDCMMKSGTDYQLSVEVYPTNASNRTVVWSSSDSSIASVSSSGMVVANARGTVAITCSTTDSSNITAECVITVWDNESDLPVMTANSFAMPSGLTQIDDEAFAGIPVSYLRIPSGVRSIGSLAFSECPNLSQIFIPASVTSIVGDAFEGNFFVSIVGYQSTYAESYANNQGIPFIALDPAPTTITLPIALTISGDSEVDVSSTLQLNGDVTPVSATVRTVKWKSSNTSIATVSDDGIVTAISPGTVTITATADGDTSLTASKIITVRQPYILAFDTNGGSCDTSSWTCYSGSEIGGTLPTASRTGYTFDGWFTAASGGSQVTAATSFTSSSMVTIYAHWTANQYPVTLNNQNATTAGSTSITATYDVAMPSFTKPTKTGYSFKGYYTAQNGGGTQYYTETGASARNWNLTSATTLYAYWMPNPYTYSIVYKSSNDTNLGTASETKNFGTTNTITPPAYTGYTTPASQSVAWDATSKTITFTYSPIPVSFTTNSGNFWNDGGITYSAEIKYQNRTADSIQIQISCTLTKQRDTVYTQNGHVFNGSCNGVSIPKTTILAVNEWKSRGPAGKSKTVTSSWVTIQNLSATQTSLDVAFRLWQVDSAGNTTGNNQINTTWTIAIPTY